MNNPIRFIDPDGMDPLSNSQGEDETRKEDRLTEMEAKDKAQDVQLSAEAMDANGGFRGVSASPEWASIPGVRVHQTANMVALSQTDITNTNVLNLLNAATVAADELQDS